MNEKVYILADILPETQTRYPHIDLRRMKTLYDGWRAKGLRQKTHSSFFYSYAWKRGWLSKNDADSLREYIGLR
ncbi:MAG: hypothetical protein II928_03870 [Paludibacteraceae bacterium]|nr:hypothetical protein [Paludibacteraceae bacterium]MBR0194828.1 hypothetical protein [Paludibacteraceae bacterium]